MKSGELQILSETETFITVSDHFHVLTVIRCIPMKANIVYVFQVCPKLHCALHFKCTVGPALLRGRTKRCTDLESAVRMLFNFGTGFESAGP